VTSVIKLGGELIEAADTRARIAATIAGRAAAGRVVVVHGGGKAIDAELARRGITPRKVDGLRITDAATLEAVIAVLAGTANTALVASLVALNVKAVGLTGVDAACGLAQVAAPLTSTTGAVVDLGLVGDPADADPALFTTLLAAGYVPVVACLGVDARGAVLNVNADVMACRIAAALGADELLIAGTTSGVFDTTGATIAELDTDGMDALVASGAANAGMVAKLNACRLALDGGVGAVRIVNGMDFSQGTTLRRQHVGTR
jgi:acetylglutamate kinase